MKEIFIEKDQLNTRIAIKDNGELTGCYIEEDTGKPQIGEIYLGTVKKILPSINSVFIDIGFETEVFMFYNQKEKSNIIKKGENILVEVIKDSVGNKSAKVSNKISIPGKYLVLSPGYSEIKFSKRITNEETKKRLLSYIEIEEDIEITIRTEAEGANKDEIQSEYEKLKDILFDLDNKLKYSKNLGRLYSDNNILNKIINNKVDLNTKIYTDSKILYKELEDKISDPKSLIYYDEVRNMYDSFSIDKEILKLRHKKVVLKCGGNIIIEKTEAMYVIDVNSANNVKGRDYSRTILETNIEAASEIGKQIILRNLSGIIVIDFIDMKDDSHKQRVYSVLLEAMKDDRGNIRILPFTELNLIQITRKRMGKSIYDYLEEECNKCRGKGYILRLSYIKNLLRNEIIKCKADNSITDFYIELDNVYRDEIEGDKLFFLKSIEALDSNIYIRYVDNIDGYKIEPLIFQKQKDELTHLKIQAYEKY